MLQRQDSPPAEARDEDGDRRPRTVIVIPLDGTPAAETVLPYAAALAVATSSGLLLLSVVPSPSITASYVPGWWSQPHILEADTTDVQLYLEGVAARWRAQGALVRTMIRFGDPARQIVACASMPNVVLIAMATRLHGWLGRWLTNDVTARVLEANVKPTLLLRAGSPAIEMPHYRTIAVPLQPETPDGPALAKALQLANKLGATVLLAAHNDTSDLGQIPGQRMRKLAISGDLESGLLRLCVAERPDLLVMPTAPVHRRWRFWRPRLGRRLLKHLVIPMLVVRSPATS